MMMNRRFISILLLGTALWIRPDAGLAAAPREEGGGDALRKAQYLLQKLTADKAALEQENLRLTEELKKAQGELGDVHDRLDKSEQARNQVQEHNIALTNRVHADNERIGELQAGYRRQIADAHADIQLLHSAVEERDTWITECQARNEGLYQANRDLLTAYRDKGALDALAQREPVTGIGVIKVENTVQEYQFRLEDLRTVKFESGPGEAEQRAAQ